MNQRIKNIAICGAAFATGIAGTAVAGQLATGSDFKDGSIKSKDLARSVRDQLSEGKPRGQQGPQGPPGLQGLPGAAGAQGTEQGPPAITTLLRGGPISGFVLNPTTPNFHAVIGGNLGTAEAGVQIPAPEAVVSAGNLRVRQNTAPLTNVTFTLRVNGINTAVACTLTPAQPTCEAASGASAAPGDLLSLGVSSTGSNVLYSGAFSLDLTLGS